MKFGDGNDGIWIEEMWTIDNEERKGGESDGIALPNKATMKGLKEVDSYKYSGVIHADGTLCYR